MLKDEILISKNMSRNAFVIFNPFHVYSASKFAKYADTAWETFFSNIQYEKRRIWRWFWTPWKLCNESYLQKS